MIHALCAGVDLPIEASPTPRTLRLHRLQLGLLQPLQPALDRRGRERGRRSQPSYCCLKGRVELGSARKQTGLRRPPEQQSRLMLSNLSNLSMLTL